MFQRFHFNFIVKLLKQKVSVKAEVEKGAPNLLQDYKIRPFVSYKFDLLSWSSYEMTQNILRLQKAFIRHWVCTNARKREREKTGTERREDRGSRNWEGKKRDEGRLNEILANAFVFATWLHRDVTMEVIGIPRMSWCNNSVCVCKPHIDALLHVCV